MSGEKAPDEQTLGRVRLVRLYLSGEGIWRYDIERDGIVKWSSLYTRNEAEARRKYESLQASFMEYARVKTIDPEVRAIQREHHASWLGREMWAIIDLPNGKFAVYWQSSSSVGPTSEYKTKWEAAARLLQMIGTGPVAPQTWPERIEVGSVKLRDAE